MPFDPAAARTRLDRFWSLDATFGSERTAYHTYLHEIVRDRYVLVNGLQLLRDELQISSAHATVGSEGEDLEVCGTDFSLPSVMTTLAHTHCGDRIHQNEAKHAYEQVVASRFAFLSEIGGVKLESFTPAGGGTDDAATLAHVTVAHQLDEKLRARLYEGNRGSFYLVNVDLQTHVGRLDEKIGVAFGKTRETPWREPRAACGAIVGALGAFHAANGVHQRIRAQLGEGNYQLLSTTGVRSDEGIDVTAIVAASILLVRGLDETLAAFTTELDARGLAHVTASLTVNRVSLDDTIVYLARGTVFDGTIKRQGFGTDATKYRAKVVRHGGDLRVRLAYDGREGADFPVETQAYEVRSGVLVLPDSVIDI